MTGGDMARVLLCGVNALAAVVGWGGSWITGLNVAAVAILGLLAIDSSIRQHR